MFNVYYYYSRDGSPCLCEDHTGGGTMGNLDFSPQFLPPLLCVIGHSSRCEVVVYVGTLLGTGNNVWLWEWLVLNSSLANLLDLLFLPFEILFLCWLEPLGWIRNL